MRSVKRRRPAHSPKQEWIYPIFAGMLFALGWFIMTSGPQSREQEFSSFSKPMPPAVSDELKAVNQKMRDLHFSDEARQLHARKNNEALIEPDRAFDYAPEIIDYENYIDNDIEQEGAASKAAKSLEEDPRRRRLGPDERVELYLQQQEELYKYDKKYESEFVRQLVQNARADGYDVLVNDKLQVVKVKKLKRRETPYSPTY